MRESELQKRIFAYARSRGAWVRKFASENHRGAPDLVLISKGDVIFIEVKRKGKRPTKLQEKTHDEMRAHGAIVFVVDDLDDAKIHIDVLCRL